MKMTEAKLQKFETTYKNEAAAYGLKATWLKATFEGGLHMMRIVGLNPRATAYPVICQDVSTNKYYKYDTETIITEFTA